MTASAVPTRGRVSRLALLALGLLVGLFAGPSGALDSVAFLAWCALVAPACGLLAEGALACGSKRGEGRLARALLVLLPLLAAVLATYACQQLGARPLPEARAGLGVICGLYLVGVGLGFVRRARPGHGSAQTLSTSVAPASVLLIAMLIGAGGPLLYGFAGENQSLGHSHRALAETLLLLAPDGLALEVSGFDWSHTNPTVYATSGVEWLPRVQRGSFAAGATLATGLLVLAGGRLLLRRVSDEHPVD